MMVYKYWDCEFRLARQVGTVGMRADRVDVDVAITKEDLEFSVGSKASVWEVKDPLLPVRRTRFASHFSPNLNDLFRIAAQPRVRRGRYRIHLPWRRRISDWWDDRKPSPLPYLVEVLK